MIEDIRVQTVPSPPGDHFVILLGDTEGGTVFLNKNGEWQPLSEPYATLDGEPTILVLAV